MSSRGFTVTSVYQRGWVINSQLAERDVTLTDSISKGMGDQFSANIASPADSVQYIKGDG